MSTALFLKDFAKFKRRHQCWSFSGNFIKRLQHKCFPVNFASLLGTFFVQNTSIQVLLNFSKMGLHQEYFPVNLHQNTSSNKIVISTNSMFSLIYYHTFSTITLSIEPSIDLSQRTGNPGTFYAITSSSSSSSSSSSCKHNGTVFYEHRNTFNFFSSILFHYFACGQNYGGKLSALFEMKLNHEI